MPAGIPLPTLAIGKAGAKNAALASISILANKYPQINKKLELFRKKQTKSIYKIPKDEKNRLGIIGGGQLGMFTCKAAKKKNIKSIVLSETEEFSAKNFVIDISFQILKT